MLRQRGRRFLCCELGNANRLDEWKTPGWTKIEGEGNAKFRVPATTGIVEYTEKFYTHFAYAYLTFRLAKPATIDGVKLALNGERVPIPESLASSGARNIWQVPLPEGMTSRNARFRLEVVAPWRVCDVAVTGDRIREMFLERLG